jgi:hypothetical protein
LLCGVLWLIACGEPRAIAQDQLVRSELRASLYFINVHYGEQRVTGQGVILRGEPLDVVVRLANRGRVGRLAVGAEREWMERVAVRVRPGGYRDAGDSTGEAMPCTWLPVAHRSHGVTTVEQGHIVLQAGASVSASCRIDSSSLSGGKHTATVNWSVNTDRASFRDLIPHELPIVIEPSGLALDIRVSSGGEPDRAGRVGFWLLPRRGFVRFARRNCSVTTEIIRV